MVPRINCFVIMVGGGDQVSGKVVDLKVANNPIATVCNYVFDSLRQDAFRVKDKTLYENRSDGNLISRYILRSTVEGLHFVQEGRGASVSQRSTLLGNGEGCRCRTFYFFCSSSIWSIERAFRK